MRSTIRRASSPAWISAPTRRWVRPTSTPTSRCSSAGNWFLFDPTGISPVTGLIRIGTGRDAADVSFATIFGPVRTGMPKVEFSAVNDPANGVMPPVDTDLAVSTAQ